LLELHANKFASIYNCPGWRVSHYERGGRSGRVTEGGDQE